MNSFETEFQVTPTSDARKAVDRLRRVRGEREQHHDTHPQVPRHRGAPLSSLPHGPQARHRFESAHRQSPSQPPVP